MDISYQNNVCIYMRVYVCLCIYMYADMYICICMYISNYKILFPHYLDQEIEYFMLRNVFSIQMFLV